MNGQVYLCSWERGGDRYTCWIKAHPEIRGEGATLGEADADLIDVLGEVTKDFRPLLEYVPPLPPSSFDSLFRGPGFVAVSAPNQRTGATLSSTDLYEKGVCPMCKRRIGGRTGTELSVKELPGKADGARVTVKPGGHDIIILSEEFLSRLDARELAALSPRPVITSGPSKRKFFEPMCQHAVPAVFVKGVAMSGWMCDECGRKEPRSYQRYSETAINYFVSVENLPTPLAPCLRVFTSGKDLLCMLRTRWEELAGKPGTEGLASSPVGVVPTHLVDSDPKVERVSEIIRKYGRF